MVCLACLLPIFLIPVVNALPLLFYLIMQKVYNLLGWEYRIPERVPPACPHKPTANNKAQVVDGTGHGLDVKPAEPEEASSTRHKEN